MVYLVFLPYQNFQNMEQQHFTVIFEITFFNFFFSAQQMGLLELR